MTLCVAKATARQIFILADTRLSNPKPGAAAGVASGCLKTLLLSTDVALSFTGDPDLAQRAVRAFRVAHGYEAPFRATIDHFCAATRDNENDYLLAFAGPKRLFRISAGRSVDRKQVWIGDKTGFERFQEGPRSLPSADFMRATFTSPDVLDLELVTDQIARFQEVVEDPSVSSVGDFYTLAASKGGTFRFLFIGTLYFDASGKLRAPDGSLILPATGENRGYAYTVWTPKDPLVCAAAFTFAEVRKAFVFHSANGGFADQCTVFDGLSGDQLAAAIEEKLGIAFNTFELRHTNPE